MRKNLLLLILLFIIGGGNLSAKELQIDLSAVINTDDNATWDSSTHTFAWTGTWSNAMQLPGVPSDMSEYTAINWTATAGTMNHFRILVYYNNSAPQTTYNPGTDMTGEHTVTFEQMGIVAANLAHISSIKISGASDGTGDIIISSVSFTGPDIVQVEAITGAETPINLMTSYHKSGDRYEPTGYTPNYRIDTPTNVAYFGVDWNGENVENYTDLSKCTNIRVYQAGQEPYVRAFFFNAAADGQQQFNFVWNSAGYYELDLATVQKEVNNLKLISIRPESGKTSSVSKIVVNCPAIDYILSGKGEISASAFNALNDESATVYDATALTGLDVKLTPANPNAIFKANAGTLSNNKNVQVGNTIANLEIADGYPLADLTGATATAATYSRTMTNQFGTICLPYAVSSTADVKYYTIDGLDGEVLKLKEEATLSAGTPAIVEKVSGEGITVTGSGALAAAGTPLDNLELIGTFENKTIMASEYPDKKLYVISNNQFVQGTNSITVPAFRAYFTSDTSSGANIRLGFADEEVTAINKLAGEGGVTVKGIYSASGASVPALQKGLNLVEFSDGSVRKVIVK